jgi:multicomponent Na+:H+ antiporter subunit C
MDLILDHLNYWIVILLMMAGLYMVISTRNYLKMIVGLNLFQTSVFIFYISLGDILGAAAPIVDGGTSTPLGYSNPLPHVLILTAIVVGVSTTALGLALIVRIKKAYGTVEEDEVTAREYDAT